MASKKVVLDNVDKMNDDVVWSLRRIIKLLESNAVVDTTGRQKVFVEGISGTTLGTGVGAGLNVPLSTAPGPSPYTTYWQPVWIGPVDQRFQVIDAARNTYANSIRNNLIFS